MMIYAGLLSPCKLLNFKKILQKYQNLFLPQYYIYAPTFFYLTSFSYVFNFTIFSCNTLFLVVPDLCHDFKILKVEDFFSKF